VLRSELTQDERRTTALVFGSAWRWCGRARIRRSGRWMLIADGRIGSAQAK